MSWVKRVNKEYIHPEFLQVMELTLKKLEDGGTPFKVYSGLRSFKEQELLYAKGRSLPGKIVTNARGGQSMHNYGLAVDLAPYNLMTPEKWDLHWPDPDKQDSVWHYLEDALFEVSQSLGFDNLEFEWGGRWKFRDVPHCQVRTTIRELRSGFYPLSKNADWMVKSHTTFLCNTPWMKRRVQYLLNELEYDCGRVDGAHGPRTEKALHEFLDDNGVRTSEEFTEEIVEMLVRSFHSGYYNEDTPVA